MNGRGEVPEGPNAMTRREARVKDGFCESKNHLSCGIEPPKRPQSASWFCRVEGAAVVSVSRAAYEWQNQETAGESRETKDSKKTRRQSGESSAHQGHTRPEGRLGEREAAESVVWWEGLLMDETLKRLSRARQSLACLPISAS
jgi:hypothetical protein